MSMLTLIEKKVMNKILLFFASLLTLSACSVSKRLADHQHVYVQNEGREAKKWKMVWKDNFNSAFLDTTKWVSENAAI